jgi:acyl-CoA thioesterase YciA
MRDPELRLSMRPQDLNGRGCVFGGYIASMIDIAAAEHVSRNYTNSILTKDLQVTYLKPILVGDRASLYVESVRPGRTSVTVEVLLEVDRIENGSITTFAAARGKVVLVSVDRSGKAVPLPGHGNAVPPSPGGS